MRGVLDEKSDGQAIILMASSVASGKSGKRTFVRGLGYVELDFAFVSQAGGGAKGPRCCRSATACPRRGF